VSLIAAELVGPSGRVTGVERDAAAVAKARARAETEGCSPYVTFCNSSLDDFDSDVPFDALIGRFVLQYQPDPAAALRRLVRLVRSGGIVVFHDMDFSNTQTSWPPCAVWDDAYALLAKLFRASDIPHPSRPESAVASSTSTAGGSMSSRPASPRTVICPAGQSTSAHRSLAIFPTRTPRRAISMMTVWSRRPPGRDRSQAQYMGSLVSRPQQMRWT
jgi:hypothetical protein